jgi:hypothetical protein
MWWRIVGMWLVLAGVSAAAAEPAREKGAVRAAPPKRFQGLPLLVVEEFDKPTDTWRPMDPAQWRFGKDGARTVYQLYRRESAYKPPVRTPPNVSILREPVVSDFVLDVWLRSTIADYPHRDMVIMFGYQDGAHHYYVHFGLKADEHSNAIMITDGKPRTRIDKTRTKGTRWSEGYHHARVVRDTKSGKIRVYFDDMNKPAMTAEDKTFLWGRVGVGSFDDTGNIDRVVLWGREVKAPVTTTRAATTRPARGE